MIGKVMIGTSFAGVVNYNLQKNDACALYTRGLRTDSIQNIIDDFNLQRKINKELGKAVGHIALSWSVHDKDKLTPDIMIERAQEYMKLMDIKNTQYIIQSLKNPPTVIFTTAFADYAVSGFELDAIDYLLKPISYERFEKAINKLLKIQPAAELEKDYTYFKVSGKLLKVFHNDLLYAKSVKDYILISTTKGNYLTHMTMKYLCGLLPTELFVRVHRSYVINKAHVAIIDKMSIKVADEIIPIGDNYRVNIEQIN